MICCTTLASGWLLGFQVGYPALRITSIHWSLCFKRSTNMAVFWVLASCLTPSVHSGDSMFTAVQSMLTSGEYIRCWHQVSMLTDSQQTCMWLTDRLSMNITDCRRKVSSDRPDFCLARSLLYWLIKHSLINRAHQAASWRPLMWVWS